MLKVNTIMPFGAWKKCHKTPTQFLKKYIFENGGRSSSEMRGA